MEPFVGIGAQLAKDEEDLVTLNPSSESDILTRSLQQFMGTCLPVSDYEAQSPILLWLIDQSLF